MVESQSEEDYEDSEESVEEEKHFKGHNSRGQKQHMKGYRKETSSTGKTKKKKKGKGNELDSSDEDQTMNRDGIFEIKESKEKFSSLQASIAVKNKAFAERLQDKMMSDLTKMIILGIITSIIIVAYFVGQLVLISNNELLIK